MENTENKTSEDLTVEQLFEKLEKSTTTEEQNTILIEIVDKIDEVTPEIKTKLRSNPTWESLLRGELIRLRERNK